MYRLILISFVIIQTGVLSLSRYCELDCQTWRGIAKHIVCERSRAKCGPGPSCHDYRPFPMTDVIRKAIVDKHNELRNKVALGLEERGPQPKAANMNVLNWNHELEFIAQCLANTCEFRHDGCRRTAHFKVGQNVGWGSSTRPGYLEDVEYIKSRIQRWYDEVAVYHPRHVQKHVGNPSTGHYTQIVWGPTESVGCGGALYWNGDDKRHEIVMVCNYGSSTTGGNTLGAPVYKRGEPCSQCPSGTKCNEKYKGLCGTDDSVQTRNSTY